ncbi:hypothetical protein BO70DRAFT_341121 [Aspergillus heteromorphus CBS 117.55]|uniref:Zn(2)-C6 fungal-type domain-containing protein n=1 Tax=Aspergillus heteromorphus CBS 117.55 TaxID=1448321 RepID=A0A317VIY4_9EURO|nr:uncharacterized protein BO70DRAFT_341121 [Aspergillus heteromorphus CBS 117.55]PWY74303.1 hypothetical protein BO70DRAFT_341121 [Aspergillus heteromorphus CBS 117.55]
MSAIRRRLACVECTRRKIRCDKVVPCRNCTRRNITCSRARGNDDEVERLQARVQELESALRDATDTPSQTLSGSELTRHDSTTPAPEGVESPEREMADAATILEFLAWGRRKNPAYHDMLARENGVEHQSPGDVTSRDEINPELGAALGYLQLLLPHRDLLQQLVTYHCECVLWYHGSFHSLRLQDDIDAFYRIANGRISHPRVDLQWVALLFSVLTGALACAPRNTAQAWGVSSWEQTPLAQRWFKAVSTCLHHADFTAIHSSYAVQAIATLTMSAHLLGFSNSLSVLLAAATRIAQGLGVHRLGPEREDTATPSLIDREIGRRAWCQLCIQDWFSIPFSESYLIPRGCVNTARPRNCHDEDMRKLSDDEPTLTNYSRFFYQVAALMPSLQDNMTASNTLYTRYEKVLEHDRKLRALATQSLPLYLRNIPVEDHPEWPRYVPWARRSLAISSSHKIIMIHRKFLELSFTNPVFARTRRTCVAAARTIIKEQKEAIHDSGPVLWIHHAFSVAASIILCLDLFHRPPSDPETTYHRQLIHDGLEILSHSESNMIARRGVHLLEALLARERDRNEVTHLPSPQHERDGTGYAHAHGDSDLDLDLVGVIRSFCEEGRWSRTRSRTLSRDGSQGWPPVERVGGSRKGQAESSTGATSPSLEGLAMSYGLECAESLEDILVLATNYAN